MGAIFKKEMRSYFTSPIGYIILAAIIWVAGGTFVDYNIRSFSADLSYVFSMIFFISVFVLALETMRLFSEEKRQKTDQALLTSPVNLTGLVVGKFLAAILLYAISLLVVLVFAVIIAFQVTPDWSVIIGNLIGLLLAGGFIISIGLFISSMTESQLIAAIVTILVSYMMLNMDGLANNFSSVPFLVTIINFLSITQRYQTFVTGIIAYNNVIFFLSIQALFLFLTVRVLDRKRWS